MSGPICGKAIPAIRHLTLAPLKLATTSLQGWRERRRLASQVAETQRQLKEAAEEELSAFHEALWDRWPDAVEQVRNRVREQEKYNGRS